MKTVSTCAIILAVMLGFTTNVNSQSLAGHWTLHITSPDKSKDSSLTIRFTDETASSCISGQWKQVVVEEFKTSDKNFFPVTDPLSYMVEGQQLTIGRNGICDAYLHLHGKLNSEGADGSYERFGMSGGKPLGAFTLTRNR